MEPDDPLLAILVCPLDKGPLTLVARRDALYNPRLRRRYPIVDGVPQLLPDSGERVSPEEHRRIMAGTGRTPPAETPEGGTGP
ncbi:Trm112 family protein [Streptomyces sp. M19]